MEISRSEYIRYYDRYFFAMAENAQTWPYVHKVYDYLEMMPVNTILNLQASPDKLPLLLVTVGLFLASGEHWMDFELNDDYTKLRRIYLPPKFLPLMRGKYPVPK